MPWHLSKSDPRKVYDERHQTVCVCQTAEQAAQIVAAITGQPQEPQQIRLQEPRPIGLPGKVHAHQAEGCCARSLGKASLAGTLDHVTIFECPRCGTAYHARTEGPVTVWEAKADAMVFKL